MLQCVQGLDTRLITVLQKPKVKAAPKKAASAKAPAKKLTQTTLKSKAKSAPAKKKAKVDSEDDMSDPVSDDDQDSLLSHTPPKAKKASAPKRAGSKPLADVENESFGGDSSSAPNKNANASDKYQKVSQKDIPLTLILTLLIVVDTTRTHHQTS